MYSSSPSISQYAMEDDGSAMEIEMDDISPLPCPPTRSASSASSSASSSPQPDEESVESIRNPGLFFRCFSFLLPCLPFFKKPRPRIISVDGRSRGGFPSNRVCNQKYNIFTFVPKSLYEQFKQFNNIYFLFIALSQLIPALRVGKLHPCLRSPPHTIQMQLGLF